MRIHISSILLTIAIFSYFGELNAVGSRGNKRKRTDNVPNVPPPAKVPDEPHRIFPYVTTRGEFLIRVWLDPTRKLVEKATIKGNIVPYGPYYNNHNFITLSVTRHGLSFVIYIENEIVIGARAPKRPKRVRLEALEPNEDTFFITYDGKNYKVKQTLQKNGAKVPLSISLMPANLHREPEVRRQKLTTHLADLGGVFFIVYQTQDLTVVGAELNPAWHNTNLVMKIV